MLIYWVENSRKYDANLPFPEVCRFEQGSDRVNWSQLISVWFDEAARIVVVRQQRVHQFEAVRARRHVNRSDLHERFELCVSVVLQHP